MAYKWKPSAAQKKEYAAKMNNPAERAEMELKKQVKADKKRAGSKFDYGTAGGNYIPTQEQYNFSMGNMGNNTPEQETAMQQVIFGYVCKEKIHHDFIHVVNEMIRATNS